MIPCLGVLVLNRGDLLERMVRSIDYPVDRLCIVQNGHEPDVVDAIKRTADSPGQWINSVYVERPFKNSGVAPAWNSIIKSFPECPYWLISNNDTLFLPGDLMKIHAMWQANQDAVITAPNGAFSCFALGPEVVSRVGLFDENIWPIYSEDLDYIIRMRRSNVRLMPLNSDIGEANNGSWAIRSSDAYRAANGETQARNEHYVATKWGRNHDLPTPYGNPTKSHRDWWYDPYHRIGQSKHWNHMENTANRVDRQGQADPIIVGHEQTQRQEPNVVTANPGETLASIITRLGLVTDKNSLHSYCDHFYEKELARYRDLPLEVVEIGIDQGGSLIMWSEYFRNAMVTGMDLQLRGNCARDCADRPNINLRIADAYSYESLVSFPQVDIIIDDGPHDLGSQIWATKNLLHRVRPGGLFVIEDVETIENAGEIMAAVPFHLKPHAEIVDLRSVKSRKDDIMVVVRVPDLPADPRNLEPTGPSLLANPVGLSMDMMAERLSHIINVIDFNGIKNILDIGAAHGYESKNLARVFTNARVHAFEPTVEHYQHCLRLFASLANPIRSRISIVPMAANDRDGPMTFYPVDTQRSVGNNTGMASKFKLIDPNVFRHELSVQKEVVVPATRLDTWCQANGVQPDIIWMDAQGAELDILKGAGQFLANARVIMTEAAIKPYYHGHTLKVDIDAYLAGFGFEELVSARKTGHEYEVDAIYVKRP